MITAKIFKIKEFKLNNDKIFYQVLGYDNWFDCIIGCYSFWGAK